MLSDRNFGLKSLQRNRVKWKHLLTENSMWHTGAEFCLSRSKRDTIKSHRHTDRVTNTYFPKKRACTSPLHQRALFYSLQSTQAHVLRWISAGHHGNQWGYSPSPCLREGGKEKERVNQQQHTFSFCLHSLPSCTHTHTKCFIHSRRSGRFLFRFRLKGVSKGGKIQVYQIDYSPF